MNILKKIFVTGGLGYIGSHTCLTLMEEGFEVYILDNLCNSNIAVLSRLEMILNKKINFIQGDIRDNQLLEKVFKTNQFSAVIHFAGLKAVGESTLTPLDYYDTNVNGTIRLLKVMQAAGVRTIVFSSSATVYGNPKKVPITEDVMCAPTNPYGQSKVMVENILRDTYRSDASWKIAILRYFNPIGAHHSGLIGEDPCGIPSNLMPYITQVAIGRREKLAVFGNDYPTQDGTGVRDYIHVVDLAEAHVAALKYYENNNHFLTLNLGTGQGHSVLDLVNTFEKVTGIKIRLDIVKRRIGDISQAWADPTLANQMIRWHAKRNIKDMCKDAWRWQEKNPEGYRKNN